MLTDYNVLVHLIDPVYCSNVMQLGTRIPMHNISCAVLLLFFYLHYISITQKQWGQKSKTKQLSKQPFLYAHKAKTKMPFVFTGFDHGNLPQYYNTTYYHE